MGLSKRYAPPPIPPPPKKPAPLLKSSTPLHYPIDLERLSHQGWVTLVIADSDSDPLHHAFSALFESSAQFFSLPTEDLTRFQIAPRQAGSASEEGYSRVEGEKCMIALRKARTTPTEFELRARAEKVWRASGSIMREVLKAIEESLGVNEGVLVRMTEKQLELPKEGEGNVATLMRMFRYDRPPPSISKGSASESGTSGTSRVVSEPHRDLGLLTIVVGHSPGLECWDPERNDWISCEAKEHGLNATLLVGQTLAKFTNGRFEAGRHRVFVHPSPTSIHDSGSSSNAEADATPLSPLTSPSYRYSLVHALRGHLPLLTSSHEFETPITGPFPPPLAWNEARIGEIYNAISKAHWNVNLSIEERRRQERELKEREVEMGMRKEGGDEGGRRRATRRFSRILDVFRRQ